MMTLKKDIIVFITTFFSLSAHSNSHTTDEYWQKPAVPDTTTYEHSFHNTGSYHKMKTWVRDESVSLGREDVGIGWKFPDVCSS